MKSNRIRSTFGVVMLAGAATMFVSANAYAAKGDPHQEEQDGCDHGNTGKDCREDPSEHGKDCDQHGKHGGVNEDHCKSTTTTEPEVTTTTAPEVTTTTAPTVVTTPTTPTAPGATDTPAPATEGARLTAPRAAAPVDQPLPATGAQSEALAAFAGGLLLLGTGLRKVIRQPISVK